jgi:integrase
MTATVISSATRKPVTRPAPSRVHQPNPATRITPLTVRNAAHGRQSGGEPVIITEHLRWIQLEGLAEGTVRTRRRVLYRLHRQLRIPLASATEDDLLGWRESLRYLGDGTTGVYVSHVRSFYDWAVLRGYCTVSPAARIPVPYVGQRLPRPADTTDLFTAIEHAPQPIRLWLILMAWCGLRCCEVARLRRENIRENADPPCLVIVADATKGRRGRIVPLSLFVVGEIRAADLPHSGWAFRRADGRPGPNSSPRVSQIIADYFRDQEMTETAHQLRHWFATNTLRSCHDLRVVQELLGHRSPKSTAVYTDWDRPTAVAAVSALPVPKPSRRLDAVR